MHVPTHIMSGWCVGNLFRLTPRERVFCMAAAAAPDLDGLTLLGGWALYQDYHHLLAHNLPFCAIAAAIMTLFSTHRKAFFIYLALGHLHLLMDFFGSGPLWKIYYLWPFSPRGWLTDHAWEFFSWQNITTAAVLLAWTVLISIKSRRTPLEALMPSLDRQLLELGTRDARRDV